MLTDNLIIAEFDEWRLRWYEVPCLSGRRSTVTRQWKARVRYLEVKDSPSALVGEYQDVNFLHGHKVKW